MNRILFLISLVLWGHASFAQKDSVTFHGKLPVTLWYTGTSSSKIVAIATIPTFFGPFAACGDEGDACGPVEKTKSLKTSSDLVVNTWGEGRIVVLLAANDLKGCAGIQGSFVGYETAAKSYDLYAKTGKETPVPNKDQAVGSLVIGGKTAYLQLHSDMVEKTTGKGGHECTWRVSKDAALKFAL